MRSLRLFLLTIGLFSLWWGGTTHTTTAQTTAVSPTVYFLTIDGPVNPAMTDYFARGIREAEANQADAVLIQLDTPGGTLNDTQEIVQLFRGAAVPVIVYIAPAGAQAASAGSIITLAAHASGMAPQTVIGAASPVNGDGSDINETMYRKVVEDTQALVRSLSEGRTAEATALAEAMIADARAVTAQEALSVGFIDAIAPTAEDLLAQLHGREIDLRGQPHTLNTAGATLIEQPQTSVESFLYHLTNIIMQPMLIGALLLLGIKAITFEVSNPGGWVAGFFGFLCLGFALYALGLLPVNWLGLALIGAAFVLFIAEAFTPTFGALTLTGVVTLFFGLLVLFNTAEMPDLFRLSIPAALLLALSSGSIFFFIIGKAIIAMRAEPQSNSDGLIGRVGQVRQSFRAKGDHYQGTIFVYGALWQATAAMPLRRGDKVTVTAINGLKLAVIPAEENTQ
ncbi:MAG: nodulation protein NfeD [Anaerolineales bacterium]|nr:nodulation protein NfeD [Anaerolineales bacterium]